MWSVGCILAELLGRKPIFPGKNFVHQLQLIFDVIGTPHTGEIERIKNKQARKFLDSIRGKVKVAFPQIIPSASEIATSALETLLLFSPSERATAAMLLGQPYLRDLSYAELPTEDPPAPHCDFSFERESLSPSQLRDKIVQEVSTQKSQILKDVLAAQGCVGRWGKYGAPVGNRETFMLVYHTAIVIYRSQAPNTRPPPPNRRMEEATTCR